MKKINNDNRETGQEVRGSSSHRTCNLRSENGVVLVVVIVLSAVALMIMTTLILLITTGTQVSGLHKSYKTALEAGIGGSDIFYELIATRAETADTNVFKANLDSFGLNSALTTSAGCQGVLGVTLYTGLAAKLLTPSTSWQNCDSDISIDPDIPATYDMKVELGTTKKYSVYAKIVATTEGNTSAGNTGLLTTGVVNASGGLVNVKPIPYMYAIETVSEKSARKAERSKLSILYRY